MVRIFRISLNTLITSMVPIIGWFLLGIILDENLINIFTLTYPLQFIMSAIVCIFGTGANISYYKDNDKNSVNSGIIIGAILGLLIYGIIAIKVDNYINFMNMDVNVYRIFCRYSVIQIYLQLVLILVLTKLYYLDDNKKANNITFIFNIINFLSLIFTAIISKDQKITATISIGMLFIYTLIIVFRNINKQKISINILKCIKYDSAELVTNISFIIIYLFGYSNLFSYGEKYVLAISFVTLITDMQWDIIAVLATVAKIDLSKNNFVYSEHLKNGYKLTLVLVLSVLVMGTALFWFYDVDILLVILYTIVDIVGFLIYPLYTIKECYFQLEYSALKNTLHKQIGNLFRILMSFLPTPFCTAIGQLSSALYQLVYTSILKHKVGMKEIIKKEI